MRVRKAIQIVRDQYPEMQIQTLFVLLTIADMEPKPVRQADLQVATSMTGGSLSRNVSILDDWSWQRRPGLKLVESYPDLMDRRHRLVTLTRKGKALVRQLQEALSSEGDT